MNALKMDILLTIVIPAYNISRYIEKLLDSILTSKKRRSIEILVINDGSNDDTKEKAKRYKQRYPDTINVIDKENGGHGSTINSGVMNASGKYFKVIDGDDWVDTIELDRFIDRLACIEDDMLVCGYTLVRDDGTIIIQKETKPSQFRYDMSYPIEEICKEEIYPFSFHSLFYKTTTFKKSKRLDENCFYVDLEYALYPLKYVDTIRFFQENIYMYRIGRSGQSVSTEGYQKNRKDLKKVLLSLSDLAVSYGLSLSKREYIIRRIGGLYTTILDVYFFMDDKREANIYLRDIEDKVKKMYPEIYNAVACNNELRFLRFFRYNGYRLLSLRRRYITKRSLKEY